MSDMPIQGSRLQYISEKASFLYVLNVPKAGKYDLKVSAYADKPDERLEIFINNAAAGAVTIKKDDKQPLADTEALSVDLKAGFNLLRLYVPTNRPYDLNSIKISAAGQTLKNTMPVFDFSVWDEELKPGETTFVRDFNIRDGETPAEKLLLSATSDTAELVPDGAIKIESGEFKGQWGNVYNRRLTVTPLAGQKGRAVITVSATDADGSKRQQSFKLKVQ